ncbi:MAG: pilin [Candidatus Moranbacteria bacterium]|jgi:hypothetical protein|nr:pilin [Candidatus Moranbacteria bacterium]
MRKNIVKKIFFLFPATLFFLYLNIFPVKAQTECEKNQGRCEIEVDITSNTDNCLPVTLYTISPDPLGCASNQVCCLPKTVIDCTGKSDGTVCGYGYCYGGECLTDDGELGEPCGNEPGSICVTQCQVANIDFGGRDCVSGLSCCEKGTANDQACLDVGGKCQPEPTDEYPTLSADTTANEACRTYAIGADEQECYLPASGNTPLPPTPTNSCLSAGGQCVSQDQNCDHPWPQYSDCPQGQKCCGPIGGESPKCPEYGEGLAGGFLFFKGSLVPCGRHCDDPGTDLDETKTCTICHLIILFKRIYDLLLSMLIIVSLVMLTVGGIIYIVSTGNPGLTSMAKGLVTKTLTGFGLFLVSWLLVFTILKFISANTDFLGDSPTNWFEFTCDVESKFDKGD